ncbi:MAG: hypothetical protein K2J66_08955, partial [Muribaculaceae bacterium]|nr:hypothetical protein [Muribaculaceae bacterium]
ACFGHNATALLPHCANTSARRLTAPTLTNIGERGLIQSRLNAVFFDKKTVIPQKKHDWRYVQST